MNTIILILIIFMMFLIFWLLYNKFVLSDKKDVIKN